MKLIIKYLANILLMIFPAYATVAQVPLNWTRDEINPGEDFTLAPDDSLYTEGLNSVHLILNSAAVPYLISDVYYIIPGTEYDFSIDVYDNDTAGQVKIYADFYDTYGFNIFGKPPVFSSDSSEWQTINWHDTIPAQAVVGYVMIKFYTQPDLYHFTQQAQIWIDNVSFKQTDVNLALNGGFEFWDLGTEENTDKGDQLFIFPNPSREFVNIRVPEDVDNILVTDFTGKEVLNVQVSDKGLYYLDVKHWPAGIYFIKAINNSRVFSSKLIIR
jgi:hypothetical protein